jgi:hypothetical protein
MKERGWYRLEGHTPVPCTLEEGAAALSDRRRIVANDELPRVRVSTVFLGLDHSWTEDGPPLVFERGEGGGFVMSRATLGWLVVGLDGPHRVYLTSSTCAERSLHQSDAYRFRSPWVARRRANWLQSNVVTADAWGEASVVRLMESLVEFRERLRADCEDLTARELRNLEREWAAAEKNVLASLAQAQRPVWKRTLRDLREVLAVYRAELKARKGEGSR